jgi:hypothetical protein
MPTSIHSWRHRNRRVCSNRQTPVGFCGNSATRSSGDDNVHYPLPNGLLRSQRDPDQLAADQRGSDEKGGSYDSPTSPPPDRSHRHRSHPSPPAGSTASDSRSYPEHVHQRSRSYRSDSRSLSNDLLHPRQLRYGCARRNGGIRLASGSGSTRTRSLRLGSSGLLEIRSEPRNKWRRFAGGIFVFAKSLPVFRLVHSCVPHCCKPLRSYPACGEGQSAVPRNTRSS